MKQMIKTFLRRSDYGGMLIELLLCVALVSLVLPFVFKYQMRAIQRAQNIAITRDMQTIQSALERYIAENRESLLRPVGKNITRVELSDLEDFGLSSDLIESGSDKYQLRILKSAEGQSSATLQGVIVMSSPDITPLRTREIVALSGDNTGFIDGTGAYGNFGIWKTDAIDFGINLREGIIQTTDISRDNTLYLWRVPSDDSADATMMSALNLGGHDIINATFFDASGISLQETLSSIDITTRDLIFKNRTTINNTFQTTNATVSGIMSSDSRNMEVSGTFSLADTGKFSSFTATDLLVTNLTLSSLTVSTSDSSPAILKINDALDMTSGRVDAMYITVGFAGSITPRLVVKSKIQDSTNSNYYWNASDGTGRFVDASFGELNRMAKLVLKSEGRTTTSSEIFSAIATNSNATVGDFMSGLRKIQSQVRAKYRLLNLE